MWLSGVRRVGKTTLARSLAGQYLNCDLPSVARQLEDPERFFATSEGPVVIFDEIHQLADPARILKIAADEFGHLRILATGSSTLAATRKFRDTLAGRRRAVHLLPVLHRELAAFGIRDLRKRLLHGGLPEPLLAEQKDADFFAEWLDSFYARDIQELFRVAKRREFLLLVETLLRQSGGLLELSSLAKHTGLSRPTVSSYLAALEATHVVVLLRPYFGGGRQELLRQPKFYAFDTGFISFYRGWERLRDEDCGALWEHLVLETLLSEARPGQLRYWRDKQKREVDFVWERAPGHLDAFECTWDAAAFSPRSLGAFRAEHPKGRNYVLSPQTGNSYASEAGGLKVVYCNLEHWSSGAAAELWQRAFSHES